MRQMFFLLLVFLFACKETPTPQPTKEPKPLSSSSSTPTKAPTTAPIKVASTQAKLASAPVAQYHWTWLNPSPSGEMLTSLWAAGPEDLFVVGTFGAILHSADEGQSWTPRNSGTSSDLIKIWGSGINDIFVLGRTPDVGTEVIHSTDGGNTWKAIWKNEKVYPADLWGSGVGTIYFTGNNRLDPYILRRTTNAGETWEELPREGGFGDMIWGSGPNDIYVVNRGSHLLHSTDGAKTWQEQEPGGPKTDPSNYISGIWGSGPNDVYVALSNSVLHSVDQGKTWESAMLPKDKAVFHIDIRAISGGGAESVYAVDEAVYQSLDHGKTWKIAYKEKDLIAAYNIWANDSGKVVAIAHDGILLASKDNGKTWTHREKNLNVSLNAIWGITEADGSLRGIYAVGKGGTILYSSDGQTWTPQKSGTKKDLHNVWGDATRGIYAVGKDGAILFSSDGQTWAPQKSGTTAFLSNFFAASTGGLYLDGEEGLTVSTDGKTWKPLAFPGAEKVKGEVCSMAEGNGGLYVATYEGPLLFTKDQGKTWEEKKSPVSFMEYAAFIWQNEGGLFLWAYYKSELWHSKDNGQSWERIALFPLVQDTERRIYDQPQDIWFGANNEIYAVTSNGMYRSGDGGLHWETVPKAGSANALWGDGKGTFYTVGFFGEILRMERTEP